MHDYLIEKQLRLRLMKWCYKYAVKKLKLWRYFLFLAEVVKSAAKTDVVTSFLVEDKTFFPCKILFLSSTLLNLSADVPPSS